MAQPIPLPRANRPATGTPIRRGRTEVRPPELWPGQTPVWVSLTHWLRRIGSASPSPTPIRDRLGRARTDFVGALGDVPGVASEDLQTRVRHARSLRELWHLRAELFSLVARRFSQAEAQHRLGLLNAHFPVHAARRGEARAS